MATELKSFPMLTRFERAALIGFRAEQLAHTAPAMLSPEKIAELNGDPVKMAEEELKTNKIPFLIRRKLPGDVIEDIKIEMTN